MAGPLLPTTARFARPFRLPGFAALLPAGDYDVETETLGPPDPGQRDRGTAADHVLVRLHPRTPHPGMARSLTVLLSALELALARDRLARSPQVEAFVEAMLADPMVQLVMQADRVSEAELRSLYALDRPPPHGDAGQRPSDGPGR